MISVAVKLTSETSTFTAVNTAMVKFLNEMLSGRSPYVSFTVLRPGKYSLMFGSRRTSFCKHNML